MAQKKTGSTESIINLNKRVASLLDSAGSSSNHLFICGEDHIVQLRTEQVTRSWSESHGYTFSKVTLPIDDESWNEIFNNVDLFAPKKLVMISGIELNALFRQRLESLVEASENFLVVMYCQKSKIDVHSKKALSKAPVTDLVFDTLSEKDVLKLVDIVSKEFGIHFEQAAVEQIRQKIGTDATAIYNELYKLSLIFNGHQESLTSADISPHISLIRDEDAFKLSEYFINGQESLALILIRSLVESGTSSLAILGIISHHLRTTIKLKQGLSTYVPWNLKLSYDKYARGKSLEALYRLLAYAQQTDLMLKSKHKKEHQPLDFLVSYMAQRV